MPQQRSPSITGYQRDRKELLDRGVGSLGRGLYWFFLVFFLITSFRDNGTPGTPLRLERSGKSTPRTAVGWVRLRGTGWCPLSLGDACEISCWDRMRWGAAREGSIDQSGASRAAARS